MFNINPLFSQSVVILSIKVLLLQSCSDGQVLGSKIEKMSSRGLNSNTASSSGSVSHEVNSKSASRGLNSNTASSSGSVSHEVNSKSAPRGLNSSTKSSSGSASREVNSESAPRGLNPSTESSSGSASREMSFELTSCGVTPNTVSSSGSASHAVSSESAPRGLDPNMASSSESISSFSTNRTEAVLGSDVGHLVFGKQAWNRHFKTHICKEPPLPLEINHILNNPCPFWTNKKVKDTHLLVLIPATVNGERCTLDKFEALTKKMGAKIAYNNGCYGDDPDVQEVCGNMLLPEKIPYWLLMTRDVLPDSRGKSYVEQQEIVNQYRTYNYRLPYGLEVVVCTLAHYVRSKERLFGDNPWTYTRCTLRQLVGGSCPLVVGGFNSWGLEVALGSDTNSKNYNLGVACCRKLT